MKPRTDGRRAAGLGARHFGLERASLAGVSWLTCSGFALLLGACSGPDRNTLFEPLERARVTGGVAAGGSQAAPPPVAMGGSSGEVTGPVGLAGAGGSAAVGPGVRDEPDAAVSDPDVVDAGPEDTGPPPPPPCVPSDEVCDGIDNDCNNVVDQGQACAAACTGFVLGGHGYMFCAQAVARTVALERCALEAMRLAWIESAEENTALVQAIAQTGAQLAGNPQLLTQIGGNDEAAEGAWRWVGNRVAPNGPTFWQGGPVGNGGEPVDDAFVVWDPPEPNNEPNEDCAAVSIFGNATRAAGTWDDRTCAATEPFPFVCEAP